jgi:phosphatidate cytidylyltransferase
MQDPNFINPLSNPIFIEVVKRFFWVFLLGLVLIFVLNKFSFREIWKKELGKRYLSWLVLGVILLFFISVGGILSLVFLFLITILAIFELVKMSNLPKTYWYGLIFLSFVSIIIVSFFPQNFYMLPILYFMVWTLIPIRINDKKGFFNSSVSLYASIWIIFALCHFVLLGHLNNSFDNTKALLFLVLFAVPLADIGAYVFGRMFSKIEFFNKFKIAENISPKKIWAGILGDIIGAGIGIWIMYFAIQNYFSIVQMIVLALLIGFFSVMGDLNESMVKRYFNVKDSSNIIPGHGGVLDRIDSILRVIVIVYYFALAVL